MEAVVEAIDLKKTYLMGKIPVHALRGVNLKVEPGEFLAILGRSGTGKSTLLHMLGALDKPTSGKVIIDGVDISTLDRGQRAHLRSRKVGFVFQFFNLVRHLTALENVEIPMIPLGVDASRRRRRALEYLRLVGLEERVDHRPFELSGGEQQRVAIARSLVNDPKIVLMDEPTGNIDSKTAEGILELVKRLNREKRQTFIVVTHSQIFKEYANRIVHLMDGRIESEERIGG
ncbi:MAG: ABC transporter ATP-binding protein [Candidatus Geothermarchaeales archaeon]